MTGKQFLKVGEAAQQIGVSAAMVYSWIADGAIETVSAPPIRGARPHKRIRVSEVRRVKRMRSLGLPLRFREGELQVLQS